MIKNVNIQTSIKDYEADKNHLGKIALYDIAKSTVLYEGDEDDWLELRLKEEKADVDRKVYCLLFVPYTLEQLGSVGWRQSYKNVEQIRLGLSKKMRIRPQGGWMMLGIRRNQDERIISGKEKKVEKGHQFHGGSGGVVFAFADGPDTVQAAGGCGKERTGGRWF